MSSEAKHQLPITPPDSMEDRNTKTIPTVANGDPIPGEKFNRRDEEEIEDALSLSGEDEADDKGWAAPVRYTKEYLDVTGAITKRTHGDEPIITTKNTSPGVIEVITEWHCGGRTRNRPAHNTKQKRKSYDNLVGRKGVSRFRIHSSKLTNVLRAIVDYYPGQDLSQDILEFTEPFWFLVHHWEKIEEYKTKHPPQHTEEYKKECNEHIDLLLNELEKHVGAEIKRERQRHSRGVVTFEYLWMLFKPGDKLFLKDNRFNILRPCLEEKITGGVINRKEKSYRISAWFIGWNGIRFSRRGLRECIRPFDGEKEITLLPIYPQTFHKDSEEELRLHQGRTLREQAIVWGEKYWNLRWPSLMEYSGKCIRPRRLIEGRVMIDEQSFLISMETPYLGSQDLNREGVTVLYQSDSDSSDDDDNQDDNSGKGKRRKWSPFRIIETADMGNRGCECEHCAKLGLIVKGTRYREYDDVDPNGEPPNRDHFFSLLDRTIGGFSLKERVLAIFDIDLIKDPTFDINLFDFLVVDEDIKSTIKSLAMNHARKAENKNKKPFAADFIRGKGEGQVFLLHGPPGVGKTCAAECVAELTKRPLLSITSGDLGTDTGELDKKLSIFFRLGELWNAIVVVDEADIYFEAREANDIARNSLVSVLLRALEYYKGILFLTTNRMGVLDEAFVSRIHVSLFFKELTNADREQIWKNNIKRLKETNVRIKEDAEKYLTSPEVIALEWNGREIRNAFQTIVALAEADCEGNADEIPKITKLHIKEVVRISKEFREYLAKLYKRIEFRQLAVRKGLRADMGSNDKGKRGGLISMHHGNHAQLDPSSD